MNQIKGNKRLAQLAELLSQHIGLHFPPERLAELRYGLASAAKDFGFENLDSCIEWLLSSPLTRQRIEVLASHLTVGETYFFREKNSLEILKKDILPVIRARHVNDHRIRIWSAGCASGEEPYSIAISLKEAISDIADWNITILATDINPRSLQKGSRGIFSKWSFRDCPSHIKQKYFQEITKGTFEIRPDIKEMVSFAYHNLAEDLYPSAFNNTYDMDVIFCRNVTMYFGSDMVKHVTEKLYQCLVDDGTLIVSLTETAQVFGSIFSAIHYPHSTIYKKCPVSEVKPDLEVKHISYQSPALPEIQPAELVAFSHELSLNSLESPEPGSSLAAIILDTAIRVNPYQQAEELFQCGNYGEAEIKVDQLLKERPDDASAMILLSRIQANRGKLKEAAQWCRKGISHDKLSPDYHYLLATILYEQGQIAEATGSLERVIYLNPGFVLAYFTLGNLTLRIGKIKEAARHFKNALSLLKKYRPDEIIPSSGGIIACRLTEMIGSYIKETL